MTKKDYELIEGCIARSRMALSLDKNQLQRHAKLLALRLVTTDLQATLKHNDPKFDSDKFLKACGIEATQ